MGIGEGLLPTALGCLVSFHPIACSASANDCQTFKGAVFCTIKSSRQQAIVRLFMLPFPKANYQFYLNITSYTSELGNGFMIN